MHREWLDLSGRLINTTYFKLKIAPVGGYRGMSGKWNEYGTSVLASNQDVFWDQWRNRRGGRGQSAPPETSDREIFADVSGKKRQGKKGKRGENWEEKAMKGGKLEMEAGKRQKKRWGPFFFAFHFWKRRKFVLGLPKWEFSTGKKHFTPGKKSGKMTLPPQKNMPVTPLFGICANGLLTYDLNKMLLTPWFYCII